ncbi:MAG: retroviral-like aspartic protease family protein [Candidatus Halichondribacter symbioticus]
MPCIWQKHNKRQAFIDVVVASEETALAIWQGLDSPMDIKPYKALVDTGAARTCITKRVADELGLPSAGMRPVNGVSGTSVHQFYTFHVGFVVSAPDTGFSEIDSPETKNPPQDFSDTHINNRIIRGAELIMPDSGFDVLLGMDILSTGSLAIEGNGTFSFSF